MDMYKPIVVCGHGCACTCELFTTDESSCRRHEASAEAHLDCQPDCLLFSQYDYARELFSQYACARDIIFRLCMDYEHTGCC
jgi:hypothetical protein